MYHLNERLGVPGDEGRVIALAVTNEDIAQFSGTASRTSLNSILRGFREQGVISTSGHDGRIVIHDASMLERYVLD